MTPNRDDHDRETVERRLQAVERALSDGDPIERADRIGELESRLVELEAAVQALRGYVGSVRAINDEVEQQADRALRKAEAIERNISPSIANAEPTLRDGAERDEQTAESRPLDRLRERL